MNLFDTKYLAKFFLTTLWLGVGWSVGLGVGVSVKATLHPAHTPVFKGFPEVFHALGVGVEEVSSYSMLYER